MLTLLSIFLTALAILLAIPVGVFFIEIIAAIVLPDRDCSRALMQKRRPRVAVLIPAHNESTGLLATVADLKAQLSAGDRVLVIADNCSDDTAAVAAAAGVEVTERNEPDKKGKGYALAYGISYLRLDPPDVVMMVDADCRVPKNALQILATTCVAAKRPVQTLSLMVAPDHSLINTRVAEFAWYVKNYVRPRGLANLGLPCQLMGTGMVFPWEIISTADLASGAIVEDLKLGLELALAGNTAIFCPSPGVVSTFPSTMEGVQSQRQRWEQGQLSTFARLGPNFFLAAVTRRNVKLLALALDLAVPPLSLLAILVTGMFMVAGVAALLGISSTAMWISSASLMGFIAAVFIAWLTYGRRILPPGSIFLVIPYVLGKLSLYRSIVSARSRSHWVRADRTKDLNE